MDIKRVCQFLLERKPGKPEAFVRYRIKWNRNKSIVSFSLGYSVNVDKWSLDTQRCKTNTTHGEKRVPANIINREIERFEKIAEEVFKFFEKSSKLPTPNEFRSEFNRQNGKLDKIIPDKTFFDIFDEFTRTVSIKNSWSTGTMARYESLKNKLHEFNPNFSLQTLTENDILDLMQSMFDSEAYNTSVAKRISEFKRFLRWAAKNGYYDGKLHETFTIKLKGTELINEPVYLSWEELMYLYSLEFPTDRKHLEPVRDSFCFLCFTSLRYSDLANLSRSDITDRHIIVVTEKTVNGIRIELNNFSRAILDKYKNVTFENDQVLPVLSNSEMNSRIRELAEFAGFTGHIKRIHYNNSERIEEIYPKYAILTSHCGRRTFVVNSLMLGIPAEVVMAWTGHKDYKSMKPYIKIVDELKEKSMQKFNEYYSPK